MKTRLLIAAMLLGSAAAMAKDIRKAVFTTQPQMHCESCENKIKSNLRFEKGIKRIETDIDRQTVTITYDADKTTPEAIVAGFRKIDYEARQKNDAEKTGGCCAGERRTCPTQGMEKAGCCQKK